MDRMLRRLRQFKPRFLQAYPSSVTLLARHIIASSAPRIESLKGIFCGSENMYAWQRELIESAFGVRVFTWYGQSEHVCLAGECEHDSSLHIFPQYSYTELLDGNGRVITEPGEVGDIVGTTFFARAMPLVRYKTDDRAAYAAGTCGACSRPYRRFEGIEGRLQEFIVARTGRPVSMTAINMHNDLFDNVRQFRFVQTVAGEVSLLVVPKETFRPDCDEGYIRAQLALKLQPDIVLTDIELVDIIPPSASGKHRFLEQHLTVDFSD